MLIMMVVEGGIKMTWEDSIQAIDNIKYTKLVEHRQLLQEEKEVLDKKIDALQHELVCVESELAIQDSKIERLKGK